MEHLASPTPAPHVTNLKAPALSASRAKEYERCPLVYRLHVVDKISEPPTRHTALGTLFHSVLEHLFDAPAKDRSVEAAHDLLEAQWAQLKDSKPQTLDLFDTDAEVAEFLTQARELLSNYFTIEDPQFISPAAREKLIDVVTPGGVRLRGFIDRIDVSPDGRLRVVDYKTGKAPSPRFQDDALYQMRFYALLLALSWKLPARTQLVYVRSGRVLTFDPAPANVEAFTTQVEDLWSRIEADARRGHFQPKQNSLCSWCQMQHLCPLFGGEVPAPPEGGFERLLRTRVS